MPKFIGFNLKDHRHYVQMFHTHRGKHDKIVVHLVTNDDSTCTAISQDQCRICPAKESGCSNYWSKINPPIKTLK